LFCGDQRQAFYPWGEHSGNPAPTRSHLTPFASSLKFGSARRHFPSNQGFHRRVGASLFKTHTAATEEDKLTNETAALRRGLTALDRALLQRLIDGEVRQRHVAELERIHTAKRRYFGEKQESRRAGT
jgi:hypothetical protein